MVTVVLKMIFQITKNKQTKNIMHKRRNIAPWRNVFNLAKRQTKRLWKLIGNGRAK